MKIEKIHIDGFGVWNDKSWGPLGPGLNVFHGPNETGKSTLMGFIRSVLFGFEKRGSSKRYDPVHGGAHGGWLDIREGERSLRLERKPGRHARGAVSVYEGDATGSDAELDALLRGTTKTLYHNVFAFGLEELEQFHTLQDTEVAQHISGAALGIGAARWSAVQKDLESRQSALFLPRGQTSTINVALKELEAVKDDLDRTEHQPEEYWAAHEARIRLSAEMEGLSEILSDLKQRTAHYEKRLKARPQWERRRLVESKLQALPVVESFPDGGLERFELLRTQLQALQAERDGIRKYLDKRRLERIEKHSTVDPEEGGRRIQVIDALRGLLPRVDATRRVYGASLEQQKAVAQERTTLESAQRNLCPPSKPAFLAFLGLIWCGGFGLVGANQPYPAAAIFALSLAPIYWYRRRCREFDLVGIQLGENEARLNTCTHEVRSVEGEARQIESEIRRLIGKAEIAQQDIDARVAELEVLAKGVEELRRFDELTGRAEADLLRLSNQVREREESIASLFAEAGAAGEGPFMERASLFRQRQQLLNELERIPQEDPEPGMLFDLRANEQEAYEQAHKELVYAEQRIVEARHESGRIDERIAIMERSEERSRALARQEVILSKIDSSAETWAILTLCRTLLDETRKVYENDRQPEVLQHASSFFSVMTERRYVRVIAPLDGTDLLVERADGVRLSPHLLSRGTAEQLYLAMRLALVRDYAHHVEPLPVVFDDVFVNFDPQRTRNTLKAVHELAQTHQVLLFTCHPHLLDLVREIVPAAGVFPLQ